MYTSATTFFQAIEVLIYSFIWLMMCVIVAMVWGYAWSPCVWRRVFVSACHADTHCALGMFFNVKMLACLSMSNHTCACAPNNEYFWFHMCIAILELCIGTSRARIRACTLYVLCAHRFLYQMSNALSFIVVVVRHLDPDGIEGGFPLKKTRASLSLLGVS